MAEETKPEAPAGGGAGSAPGGPKPPPKPAGPAVEPWESETVARLRARFGEAIQEASTYLGQNFLVIDAAKNVEICSYLKQEEQFNMLADLTAVDYPQRPRRFELIYQLYSFPRNERLRVKTQVSENETVRSVTAVWHGANWLEREAYDMFGIRFEGHPNMRRILLPEDWEGHPLRKDYGIIQQDVKWVQENLHIESGQ